MSYQDPDVISDEGALAAEFLNRLAEIIEGWEPHDGQIEPALAEAGALIASATNQLLKDAARADYASWGATVLGLPRDPAATAETTAIVTTTDDAGYTLPAGAQLAAPRSDGDLVPLVTLEDAVIPAGLTAGPPVAVAAVDPGTSGNGAFGVATLVDPYEYVQSIVLESPTSGGADQEDAEDYLPRLVRRARRQLAVPVTVADFASFARDVPGVGRVLAINLLDPAHPEQIGTQDAEGHLTLVVLDEEGADAGVGLNTAVLEAVTGDETRPLQVVVHTMGTVRTPISVQFSATVEEGSDEPAVIEAAEDAVRAYLDPAAFGVDDAEAGGWDPLRAVYYLEVAEVIQAVEGIALVTALTINGDRENVSLPGLAPLPDVISVVGNTGSLDVLEDDFDDLDDLEQSFAGLDNLEAYYA